MRVARRRAGFVVLLVLLSVYFIVRGVIPALSGFETDFPNYYTAGFVLLGGGDVSRLYDDVWFQDQMTSAGLPGKGKFSPFPPVTALVSAPLALMQPETAWLVVTLLNCGLVVTCCVLLSRLTGHGLLAASVFALLAGTGLANCVRFGQVYLLVAATMLWGLTAVHRRPVAAGISGGFFAPVKYYPFVFLIWLTLRNHRRTAVAMGAVAAIMAVLGVSIMGLPIHIEYFTRVLPDHLLSDFSGQDRFSAAFQSWDSLLRNLFEGDPGRNPSPVLSLPEVIVPAKVFIAACIVTLMVILLRRMRARAADPDGGLTLGLLGLAPILLAPGSGTYHGILLWIPVGAFLASSRIPLLRRERRVVLASYAAIGFLPYGFLEQFRGGISSVLAFPRLWLITVLFSTMVVAAWKCAAAAGDTPPRS